MREGLTKQEQRDSVPDPVFDEGKSWFLYIKKQFEALGGQVPDYEKGGRDFFLAIGLLGRVADFDIDDVDYEGWE